MRQKSGRGTTPNWIFFEVKEIMQLVTSIVSARIEGNHTTVVDVLAAINEQQDGKTDEPEDIAEITNISDGIDFIEKHVHDMPIDKEFICQLHRIVIKDLRREGDDRPGAYRTKPVKIEKSDHTPPMAADVADHMDELIAFINRDDGPQFDLLKDAVVHHRFAWIHPFGNGNGRVSRLLTYAMMAKQGFIDSSGVRLLNPTAVFGSDREAYYDHLAKADSLADADVLAWASYMLTGVKADLDNIARLQDADFVRREILIPALKTARERGQVSERDLKMLTIAAKNESVQATDFDDVLKNATSHVIRAQAIQKLKSARLLRPIKPNARRYTIQLVPNVLTSHIMDRLGHNGLLPALLSDNLSDQQ